MVSTNLCAVVQDCIYNIEYVLMCTKLGIIAVYHCTFSIWNMSIVNMEEAICERHQKGYEKRKIQLSFCVTLRLFLKYSENKICEI